jgi:prepilin-type processing-associated H-X9-DG protein
MMVEASTRQDGNACFRFTSHLAVLAAPQPHPNQEGFECHLGQSNFLFIDGHIRRLLPRDAGHLANNQEYYLP